MQSERGNVVVYLLIGLVLFGAMLSGVWWVKKQVSKPVSVPIATNSQNKSTTPETTIQQDTGGTAGSQPTDQQSQSVPSQSSPEFPQQTSSTSTSEPSTGRSESSSQQTSTPSTPESQTAPTGTTHAAGLANTGPVEDGIVSAMLLGIATYAFVLYARSRRSVA